MEWTQMSAEEDLRWYFQVAEHECCFLSSFGGPRWKDSES